MKKKLYKNEEDINRLCILKKLIKLKKQDYLSILSIYLSMCIYVCISMYQEYFPLKVS